MQILPRRENTEYKEQEENPLNILTLQKYTTLITIIISTKGTRHSIWVKRICQLHRTRKCQRCGQHEWNSNSERKIAENTAKDYSWRFNNSTNKPAYTTFILILVTFILQMLMIM